MTPLPDQITLPNLDATEALAAKFAACVSPGDCLLLSGSIGAGKSAFTRALIRSVVGRMIEVPSPTFTLVQTYDTPIGEIWHCDLYRLTHPNEAIELGLEQAFDSAITLIEWPDRLGDLAPHTALKLAFTAAADAHFVTLDDPSGAWASRLGALHG